MKKIIKHTILFIILSSSGTFYPQTSYNVNTNITLPINTTYEYLNISSYYSIFVGCSQNTSFYGEIKGRDICIKPSENNSIIIKPESFDYSNNIPDTRTGGRGTSLQTGVRGTTGSPNSISILLYHNPVQEILNFSIDNNYIYNYTIYEAATGLLKLQQFVSPPTNNISTNVATLNSGIYILKIDLGNYTYLTVQFIKQ